MPQQAETWKTRDGRILDVCDMTDSHVVNAVRYCRRNQERIRMRSAMQICNFASTLQGEYALDTVDSVLTSLAEADDDEMLVQTVVGYGALLNEYYRRGLSEHERDDT